MTEIKLLEGVAAEVSRIGVFKNKPIRVAINGIEGTGKTEFAKKLIIYLNEKGKNAIHVSIDGFHFNKERRYRQGRNSDKGYYDDAYDELGFVQNVLIASQSTQPKITMATHDLETDAYLQLAPINIASDSIIITDGAYLFKPIYINHWDLKIYLKTDFETAIQRGVQRDAKHLGGQNAAKEKFENRYHKASKRYIAEVNPEALADIVIDNTDFEHLKVVKIR